MLRAREQAVAIEGDGAPELLEGPLQELSVAADPVEAAGRLTAALRSLRSPVHPRDARRLLDYIAAVGSGADVDARGVLCRAEAIAALLRLGYPLALMVTPEDLAWFRALSQRAPSRRWWLVGAGVAAAFALAASVGAHGLSDATRPVPLRTVSAVPPRDVPRELEVGGTKATAQLIGLSFPVVELRVTRPTPGERPAQEVVQIDFEDPETGRVVQHWVRPKGTAQYSPLLGAGVWRYPLKVQLAPRRWNVIAHVSLDGAPPMPLAVANERPSPRAVR